MKFIWTLTHKVWVGLRVVVIGSLVFIVPRFYIAIAENSHPIPIVDLQFRLGHENITPQFLYHFVDGPKKMRVGLITNHTGVNPDGGRNIEAFLRHGIDIRRLYAPEHGFSGKVLAEKKVGNAVDDKTKIPIVSLYEGNSQFKKFTPEDLKDIDVFFFEMQDCGMRHYTYFPILYKCMEIAAEYGKKIVVFDRQNPLGGVMEGPLVDPDNHSFISIASYPLRHGMTLGELALYCNDKILKKKAKLCVVPMKNYDRSSKVDALCSPLSPNIPTMDACKGYGFLGLLGEISPFCVGVGTPKSFQFIGLPRDLNIPMSKWYSLKEKLKQWGVNCRGSTLYDSKKKMSFRGLNINIEDPNEFSGVNALIEIVNHFKGSIDYSFGPSFNKAVGINELKDNLQNKCNRQAFTLKANKQLNEFYTKAEPYFMYKPYPQMTFCSE